MILPFVYRTLRRSVFQGRVAVSDRQTRVPPQERTLSGGRPDQRSSGHLGHPQEVDRREHQHHAKQSPSPGEQSPMDPVQDQRRILHWFQRRPGARVCSFL